MDDTALIGYAQSVITPTLDRSVYLAGFGRNRRAESVHDDLTARALSLTHHQTTLVLCAVDLIGLFRPDVLEITRRVQAAHPGAQVILAATHTHHGPDTMGLWGPNMRTRGVDETYMAALKDTITRTILSSLQNPQPAHLRAAAVRVPGLAKNARNPDIVDDELTVLQFTTPAGQALASLFNFPCHPEVLWEHNPHITSDYPASLRTEAERQTGAPCLFFSGALGGMMTPDVKDHSFEEAQAMGKALATAGLKALAETPAQPITDLRVQKKEIAVKLTNPLYKLAFFLKVLPDVRDHRGQIHSEVNLVRLGSAWFTCVPGELLPKLGLHLKADLLAAGAQVAGVIGLANDELGYILPVEDFRYPLNPFNPGAHYEETNSIGRDIATEVTGALRELV